MKPWPICKIQPILETSQSTVRNNKRKTSSDNESSVGEASKCRDVSASESFTKFNVLTQQPQQQQQRVLSNNHSDSVPARRSGAISTIMDTRRAKATPPKQAAFRLDVMTRDDHDLQELKDRAIRECEQKQKAVRRHQFPIIPASGGYSASITDTPHLLTTSTAPIVPAHPTPTAPTAAAPTAPTAPTTTPRSSNSSSSVPATKRAEDIALLQAVIRDNEVFDKFSALQQKSLKDRLFALLLQ